MCKQTPRAKALKNGDIESFLNRHPFRRNEGSAKPTVSTKTKDIMAIGVALIGGGIWAIEENLV
jgi:hypothetical protein